MLNACKCLRSISFAPVVCSTSSRNSALGRRQVRTQCFVTCNQCRFKPCCSEHLLFAHHRSHAFNTWAYSTDMRHQMKLCKRSGVFAQKNNIKKMSHYINIKKMSHFFFRRRPLEVLVDGIFCGANHDTGQSGNYVSESQTCLNA